MKIKDRIENVKDNIRDFLDYVGFETKSQKIKRMEDEINRLTNENLKLQGYNYTVKRYF